VKGHTLYNTDPSAVLLTFTPTHIITQTPAQTHHSGFMIAVSISCGDYSLGLVANVRVLDDVPRLAVLRAA
jgi:hypothetical protein